ncbi:MAG TPA: alpha/beta fold hydrolase [Methylotenera sp.]|nr:alpha/beta fold hydrolase [Methylotenera sp.]
MSSRGGDVAHKYGLISEPAPARPASLHCMLVHGTYATNALWPHFDSSFSSALKNLEPTGVQIHRFCWSGRNSHQHRCDAASKLGADAAELAKQYAPARILLIGHSHGGNIICAAARQIPPQQVAGVITLATPFFHVERRSLKAVAMITPLFLSMIFTISLISLYGWYDEWKMHLIHQIFNINSSKEHSILAKILAALLAVSSAISIGIYLYYRFESVYRERHNVLIQMQDEHLTSWDAMRPNLNRTLCLSMSLDEAIFGLSGVRIFADFGHRLVGFIQRHSFIALSIASIPASLGLLYYYIHYTTLDFSLYLAAGRASAAVWIFLPAVAIFVIFSAWMLTAAFSMLVHVGYGTQSLQSALMLNISINRLPQISSADITHENISLSLRQFIRGGLGLIHSRLYQDDRTVAAIAKWYRVSSLERFTITD